MKASKTDILIIGGGIAGLTLGILLGQAGLECAIVDPAPPPEPGTIKPSGRTVALMNTSLNIIKAAGIWPAVEDRSNPLQTMRIFDDSTHAGKPLIANFPAAEIGQEQFGYNVPNGFLRAALYQKALETDHVKLYAPDALQNYEISANAIAAKLDSGEIIQAALIVGADGRHSKVREIAKIPAKRRDYGQSAITCLISHSEPHENISTEFHRPSGPLALVPLPGNTSSVVWVEPSKRAEDIMTLEKEDFTALLQKKTQNLLGDIALECAPECWPLCAMKAQSLTAARTALMAEAAHVMSPITAQGLNLSLRDVAVLAEIIVDARRAGLDPGAAPALESYEKRRRRDIGTRAFGVDTMMRIVSQDAPAVKGLRRAGLKLVGNLPALKNIAMHEGLAPGRHTGRVVSGEAL